MISLSYECFKAKIKVTSDEWKWFKKQAGLRMLTGKSLTWQVWVVWGLLLDWGVLVVGTSRLADTSKPPTTIITAFPVNCTRTAMSRKNNETPRNPCYAQRLSLHLSLSVPIAPKMQCQELTKHKQTPRNLLLCFARQCTSCFPQRMLYCTPLEWKKENIIRHLERLSFPLWSFLCSPKGYQLLPTWYGSETPLFGSTRISEAPGHITPAGQVVQIRGNKFNFHRPIVALDKLEWLQSDFSNWPVIKK